ncbi:MAG: capsular biosynthesis protein [Hyphomicrobiales bacterium]|nr:capsular biosynthesis protein [Hyphomicrobiales bacterium]
MNMHRLPPTSRDMMPALPDSGRGVDMPYRGGAAPEFESRESPLRTTLLRYLNLGLKHKLLIACFCAAAIFAGFVVTFMTIKLYSASTTVKIDRAAPKVLKDQSQLEGGADPQFYQTQYELIKSRSLAERVATSLNLGQTDFVAGGTPSLWSRLLGRGSGPGQVAADAALVQARQGQAVGQIMNGLAVQPVALSSLVRIRYTSDSPHWAQAISIAVADQYERSTLDRRFTASKHARDFLEERLQELKLKLQDSEKQLIAYAQKEGIVNVDDKQPEAAAALQGVQNALAAAVMERIKTEQLWQQAEADTGMGLPQIMNDGLIQAARGRMATLQATYQDKLNVLKPAYPEMLALKTQINETEKQIRTQIALVKKSIQAQYEAARAQEVALLQKVEQTKAQVLDQRGRSVEYTILLREVDTNRSLYDGLLQQFREMGVAGDVDTNNVSIIDKAQLPSVPDSPSLPKNLMISLLLGLLGAAGVIAVREALDDTFKSVEDLEEGLGLSVLGVTPLYVDATGKSSPIQEVMTDPTSPLAEAYRSLRTALQFSTADGAPKTLLVTSSQPGEGKSTTSAALAVNFAQLGQRVLLIDADMRNPSMHKLLKLDNSVGLSTFLSGTTEASQLVKGCSIDGVTFMGTGPLPPNPAELLARPRFASLLSTASETFDIIIIDGPPVMGLADVPIITSMVEGTLLVVETARTRRAIVRDAVKRLSFARARLVGVVLNKFDPSKAGYSYGYGYGYGYAYGGSNYFSYGGKKSLPELTDS